MGHMVMQVQFSEPQEMRVGHTTQSVSRVTVERSRAGHLRVLGAVESADGQRSLQWLSVVGPVENWLERILQLADVVSPLPDPPLKGLGG